MGRKRGKRKLNKQVYKNKAMIKRLNAGVEAKYIETEFNDQDVNTTGVANCINACSQGTTINTRVGNQVQAKRITLRANVHNNHGTPEDCIVRVILFRARAQNNAPQNLTMLLNSGFTTMSQYYVAHKPRFQVLFDKTWAMDTLGHSTIPLYWTGKINTVVQYNGNAGSSADIENNGYYLAYFSNVSGTTNDPLIDFVVRFWFDDA